ncbi:S-adenosyl-L-methionine-dependent methyltransferase [Corynespora cassiicola Philippines]|uniref:S-adenosyl-L-methionine-dependent methyltransferase n=1 Tax=Corynespora cassiicola Philippines TaxID=1448308 RepID=A0A2T2NXB3_CORCC|nr:S-adenosyl-L-methionine-dependent methyltransferase [Corynespora cassiicola Philippines]
MSGPYLHGHHASVLRSHSWRTVDNSAPHLIPYLNDTPIKILDVGCGPGTISVDLASRIPHGFVYAIDPSADVIEKARKHAEEKGVTNVRFEVGDIFKWQELDEVKEGTFDIVHAHQVLQHLQDPLGAMKEMKRLTKPGGIVAVRDVDYSAMIWYPEIEGMQKWQDLYLSVAKGLNCDPNIGKRLHAVAMEAGFPRSDIDASTHTWTFSTPEERAWWCGLWADRTVQSDYKKKALDSGFATEEDLHRISETWRELEKREDGWFAVINGQVVCHVRA